MHPLLELARRILVERARRMALILAAVKVGGEVLIIVLAFLLLLAMLASPMMIAERLAGLLKP